MKFILILHIATGWSGVAVTAEFYSKVSCEYAIKEAAAEFTYNRVKGVCVPKGQTRP